MASITVSSPLQFFYCFLKTHLVFLTTIPPIFTETYHERVGIAGLHYLALGIGLFISVQLNARFIDRIYIYFKSRNEGVGEPEYRLREFQVSALPMSVGY